ncbi:MAG: fatty acid desaturase [Alphaproteobacteria bacterium]|nr:fatty acid desaturase [Alphaproteobacteria bacterium]
MRGLALLGTYFCLYYATMIGAVADLPLAANLVLGFFNGYMIGMIFIIGHDCGHRAFVPGRGLNWWLGRLAFIPCAHSITLWDVGHNKTHHARTNLKGFDYPWSPMSKEDYDACGPFRRFLERVYRSPFGPLVYYYPQIWLPRLVLPVAHDSRHEWRRHVFDSAFVILGLIATIAGVLVLGQWLAPERPLWLTFVVGWVVPFAVWNYLMALSIYLQHTHPRIPWFDNEDEWSFYNGNIRGTTHVEFPKFTGLMRNVHEHPAHHALPSIPIYKLEQAESKLLDAFGEDVVRYKWTPAAYLAVTRACKLYDFRNHVWTDFQGRPTGARTLPVRLSAARAGRPLRVASAEDRAEDRAD